MQKLCQPAILPIVIDVYPTQEEFNEKYTFTFYDLNLAAMDITYYKTHADLLMEMVRQRLTQDFQLVPQSVIKASKDKSKRDNDDKHRRAYQTKKNSTDLSGGKDYPRKVDNASVVSEENPPIALSMGHRLQTMQYNPDVDAIRVIAYSRNDTSNKRGNKFKYNFQLWQHASKAYISSNQNFDKYPGEYTWNQLDNLICGDTEKALSKTFRYVKDIMNKFHIVTSHLYIGSFIVDYFT